jgi:hypothetical protein
MNPIVPNVYATKKLHKHKNTNQTNNKLEKCPCVRISKTIIQNITQLLAATIHI